MKKFIVFLILISAIIVFFFFGKYEIVEDGIIRVPAKEVASFNFYYNGYLTPDRKKLYVKSGDYLSVYINDDVDSGRFSPLYSGRISAADFIVTDTALYEEAFSLERILTDLSDGFKEHYENRPRLPETPDSLSDYINGEDGDDTSKNILTVIKGFFSWLGAIFKYIFNLLVFVVKFIVNLIGYIGVFFKGVGLSWDFL